MSTQFSRRAFLSGLTAAGAVALVPDVLKAAQARGAAAAAPSSRRVVDTHYHYASPKYSEVLRPMGTGQTGIIEWNLAKAVEEMDRWGVATSMASISEPGVHFGDDAQARALARDCNEFGAKMMADYPGRFGLFAILLLVPVAFVVAETLAQARDAAWERGRELTVGAARGQCPEPRVASLSVFRPALTRLQLAPGPVCAGAYWV